MARKWTEKSDMAADKRAGIKQGSKKDNALDRKRGVPIGAGHAANKLNPLGAGADKAKKLPPWLKKKGK
jgi:hypothetical protein